MLILLGRFLHSREGGSEANLEAAREALRALQRAHSGETGLTARPFPAAAAQTTPTAAEIVAGKVAAFARSRRDLIRARARRLKIEVPAEFESFLEAVETRPFDEVKDLFQSMQERRKTEPTPPERNLLWPPISETFGVADTAHDWPAQALLDYGQAVLGSLRPGMVYVGGTDPGRYIPTLLNETSEGDHHVILTQNALADLTYLDYIGYLHGDEIAPLTGEDSTKAFQDYMQDARKRFDHDQQFPDEPKQLRPREDVQVVDNRIQVSGQVAVMSINDRLLQALRQKNPDTPFALEESFSLASTYVGAAPLGPILELGGENSQATLTPGAAAESLSYWRETVQRLAVDPETATHADARKAYAQMATAQANLFASQNYVPEAEQAYRLASECSPSFLEPVGQLSKLLGQTGRAAEAHQLLETFARNHDAQRPDVDALRATLIADSPGR